MEQKAFYEIEKPAKKSYAVIVREIKTNTEVFCQYPGCDSNEDDYDIEFYECPCCGRWICDDHMSQEAFHNECVCKGCEKLSKEDIEKIVKLREELNS
jgi:hypothetical protein